MRCAQERRWRMLSEPYLITQDIALPGFKIGSYFHPKRLANGTTQQERILQSTASGATNQSSGMLY